MILLLFLGDNILITCIDRSSCDAAALFGCLNFAPYGKAKKYYHITTTRVLINCVLQRYFQAPFFIFFCLFLFPISSIIFALLFSLPPSRNSDPGSHGRLFSTSTHYGSCLAFLSREDFSSFLPRRLASNCACTAVSASPHDPQRTRYYSTGGSLYYRFNGA